MPPFSPAEIAAARRSPPLAEIRAAHAAKEARAKLPPPPVQRKGVNVGRAALALATGGASEIVRAAGGKRGNKGPRRGVFGELLHDVGDTKGIGRVALALATGGGSEIARLAAHETEKMIHGPGSPYPSRRNQGRLAVRTSPAHADVVEAAHAAVEGRTVPPRPPVPAGRLHSQRRLDARAKNGFYKHLSPEDLQ